MESKKLWDLGSHEKAKAEELYIQVLIELEKATSEGNVASLAKSSNLIDYASRVESAATLRNYYDNAINPLKHTNLVILACKHNRVKIVEYLFTNGTRILSNLSVGIGRTTILPSDEDETHHNAFYYAIRSGNIDLLEALISRWPGNYFAVHPRQLDEVLSRAYKELKLRNVALSHDTEIFVENQLIDLRFFNTLGQVCSVFNNVRERIDLVLQSINSANAQNSSTEEVDEKFLFMLKFIAQNIHVLKRQLKSTYDRLPWEEMEFCLVSFVSSHTKRQEINVFYRAILNKSKILKYLDNFAKRLEAEEDLDDGDISKLSNLPILQREKVVAEIICKYPQFEELYNDYKQIRDFHSLMKISEYTTLALSTNPKKREGQLVITRALQVVGEYLKNTLESPKLSNTTTELFLLSLTKDTRKIIAGLRNSLSHAYSLSRRMEVEENTNTNFYIGIQNDMKKFGDIATGILYNNKIKMIRMLLEKIGASNNFNEIKEVTTVFHNVGITTLFSSHLDVMEEDKLEKSVKELSNNISDKTYYETELFNKIYKIINSSKSKSKNFRIDYFTGFAMLKSLTKYLGEGNIDHNAVRSLKFIANKILENTICQIQPHNFKEIAEALLKIYHSVSARKPRSELDEVNRIFLEILHIAESEIGDLKWIEALRESLTKKDSFISTRKEKRSCNVTENKHNQLALKLSELKSILSSNTLNDNRIEKFPSFKSNKKLQAAVEMLVLDIMSILGSSKNCLVNNLFSLDDDTPLLTGKCLRDHLAHDNALTDVLLFDPSTAIMLNAKKLAKENLTSGKNKFGQFVDDDPSKLKDKYHKDLAIIINQGRMFAALEDGNLDSLKSSIEKGADIHARSINLWTTLHFASKGPSLEVVKFVLQTDQNLGGNVKDIEGRSPLHIAAAYGRSDIVEFLVTEAGLHVDDLEGVNRTALHFASQNGHMDTVGVLLRYDASTNVKDVTGFSPLHYAIKNNHIDVVKVLLEKEVDVDANEVMGGFTSLHIAAEVGHLELVNFLVENRANVNARNDRNTIPLHTAALNGHVEVVNVLVLNGADVNARVTEGCTPLHYAVENGHEEIANILLEYGSEVDTSDKTYNYTPLHYAAKDGYSGIANSLLKNRASVNVATVEGVTPLHFAAQSGHSNIVMALLQHGSNIHARDRNNATPLHYAAESGHTEVAGLLIKHGAQINAKTRDNSTSLHLAALKGRKSVTDFLILSKAEVNAQTIEGRTPLHAAAISGSKDVIDILIKSNARVHAASSGGTTPLHDATLTGSEEAVALLIKHRADVNAKNICGLTPFHTAIMRGHEDIVSLLIKNGARVNAADIAPLDIAVEVECKEIVEILVANGADVNAKGNKVPLAPLSAAVAHNRKEIVEVLIRHGANINAEGMDPLSKAVLCGYRDIVDLLLRHNACVNVRDVDNSTPLHAAAGRGDKRIVNSLVTRGADVDAVTIHNATPLHFAARKGSEETVEILIAQGSNVNFRCDEGITPLHIAATNGHTGVVKVLLQNGGDFTVKDDKNRTPLELAVAHGRLQVVEMFLRYEEVDVNTKGDEGWTMLHIVSQRRDLDTVKYLIDKGCDINATNASGSKPIHIATREGCRDTVEYFLSKGMKVDELSASKQTLLHYAAMNGHIEIVKYLISEGADVNAKDTNDVTPMHVAATFGFKNVIEVLLESGAVFNAADKCFRRPLDMASNKNVIDQLASTEKLFDVVKRNCLSEAEDRIKAGAFVNAKNADGVTPLHYASWKGYHGIVDVLLQNMANSNAVGKKGFTPLHYAAKFSHLKIVVTLLSNGAIYNALSDGGKTPLDFAIDCSVISLFKLLSNSFEHVKHGNCKVINVLNKINDIVTVKAIMRACNREKETLVVVAMHNNFPKVEQLKEVSQHNLSHQVDTALELASMCNYQRALNILTNAFEIRKEILGPDNPGTLDIQAHIAQVLYKQGVYQEALNMSEEIFLKRKEILGLNHESTLRTRSIIALILHRQGRNDEAFDIYREVYEKQKGLLGPNHPDTLDTRLHMALVLDGQGKYEEALIINEEIFQKRKKLLGANSPSTISAQNNIAMVLAKQGKHEEALKVYREVYERKKSVLGANHSDTLRTLHNIGGVLLLQKKATEALKVHREILDIQRRVLGENHPDTLNTQCNIANTLFKQGKCVGALKAYKECFEQIKAVFGPSHPNVLYISTRIEAIKYKFKLLGSSATEVLQHLQNDINVAASKGDTRAIIGLLKDGVNANDRDVDGRSPLHYAVSYGHVDAVNTLLENGADVTRTTNKGNTPLHTAASTGRADVMETLLRHVTGDRLNGLVNAKTTAGGATALHVAAKGGFVEITKSLLRHGAIYNPVNKEGKTPIELSNHEVVVDLLRSVEDFFGDARNGNLRIINKLREIEPDEFVAVTNARNKRGNTLLQVALVNKHNNVAGKLLEMLKKPN